MTTCVRILSTCALDSSPSILLVSPDGSRILAHQSLGGLPGMILTMSDVAALSTEALKSTVMKNEEIKVLTEQMDAQPVLDGMDLFGPQGTKAWVHSLRHFMKRDKFPIRIHEEVDSNIRIDSKHRKRKRGGKKADPGQLGFSICCLCFGSTSRVYQSRSGEAFLTRDNTESNDKVEHSKSWRLSYLFTTPPIPGKFQPDIAAKLGVPKGPLFGKLKNGQSVTFMDAVSGLEKVVQSHQVVTPSCPSVAVLVLCYENDEQSKHILSSNIWARLFLPQSIGDNKTQDVIYQIDIIIHMAPFSSFILQFAQYCDEHQPDWKVEHIFLSTNDSFDSQKTPYPYDNEISFRSAAIGAVSRSCIHSDIYRLPFLSSRTNTLEPAVVGNDISIDASPYKIGRIMMEYTLVPRSKRGFTQLCLSNYQDLIEDAQKLSEKLGAVALARDVLECAPLAPNDSMSVGELIFAGTGAALPCKHRNVTGIALKAANEKLMLLDVGEGTIGQLLCIQRGLNQLDYQKFLSQISAVWISHPHADHHLGLLRLLHDRKNAIPLLLCAPTPILEFLKEYEEMDCSIKGSYKPIDCSAIVQFDHETRDCFASTFDFTSVRAVPVAHCPHAYAVIIGGTPFGRIVYSGDCRPSKRLANAAFDADVLIHEATFEDGMEAEALLKRHSTVGEALTVAHEMHCKCTILTHFSQRYPKIPPISSTLASGFVSDMPIVFAFDYMRLTPRTLNIASKLTPALELLYSENKEGEVKVTTDANEAETLLAIPGLFARSDIL